MKFVVVPVCPRLPKNYHLSDWLTWFMFEEGNMKGLDSIMERNPAIKEAHPLYEKFTADKELMKKYETRQKYLRDVSTIKSVSHDEGFAKGKEEGRQEGRQEGEQIGVRKVVVTMHQKEFGVSTIAKSTGLSAEEIQTIIAVEM